MSIAGPYLFTTDDQRDIVLYITSEARKLTGFPITLWYPEAKAPVLWIMNGGLYHELLQVFWRRKSHRDVSSIVVGPRVDSASFLANTMCRIRCSF